MQREVILSGIKDGFRIIDPDCVPKDVETDNNSPVTAQNVRAEVEF